MPTIKGGLKLGSHSTEEDRAKLAKATGREVLLKGKSAPKPEEKEEVV